MGRKILIIFGAAGVLVGVFAVATALATHDANTIHGCVNDRSGVLRVVADPGDCRRSESALDWNVQGVAGQDGADGAQGPAGAAVAYAHVRADGTVDQDSGNITVSRSTLNSAGVYCIDVTDATAHVAVASLDSRANVGGSVQAGVFAASACPAGSRDIFVITRSHSQDGGTPGADRAFYIIVN
ncbi:MAG: hypothetical protein ACR2N9_10190 [Acidimicrobiia bacterium]